MRRKLAEKRLHGTDAHRDDGTRDRNPSVVQRLEQVVFDSYMPDIAPEGA